MGFCWRWVRVNFPLGVVCTAAIWITLCYLALPKGPGVDESSAYSLVTDLPVEEGNKKKAMPKFHINSLDTKVTIK